MDLVPDAERLHDERVLGLLRARDGLTTLAATSDGRHLTVHNIAWGYDIGDISAHITSNISPEVDGAAIDVFYSSDVESLADPEAPEVNLLDHGLMGEPATDRE